MAAIQYDGVDATIAAPASDIEKSDIISLSSGAIVSQNYTVSVPSSDIEKSADVVSLSTGSVLSQNYSVSIPFEGASSSEVAREFWG
jgi:hypothetical protein